jgi:hypothetical protein
VKRREFIALAGGAAAWPLGARAQQPGKLPTIGFLGTTTPSAQNQWTAAFVQRLRELGWIEGRNVAIGPSRPITMFASSLPPTDPLAPLLAAGERHPRTL